MITKIEGGSVDISQKKIVAFAKALSTSPAYLMGWVEDSSPVVMIKEDDLSSEEQRLVCLYRNAEESAKAFAVEMLENHQKKDTASSAI